MMPLTMFGYLPTFFDAPINPDHPDMEWIARTFLVRVAVRQPRTLTLVAGFTWGYQLRNGTAEPIKPTPATIEDWDSATSTVDADLDGWNLRAAR